MQWLGNNGFGQHPTRIGFVSLKTCQAIVYVTRHNIYGLHNYDWGSKLVYDARRRLSEKSADEMLHLKARAFAAFVQGVDQAHHAHSKIMYAVINSGQRYGIEKDAVSSWKSDVEVFSKELGFKGERFGFRVPDDVGNGGGVNVLFDRKNTPGNELQIYYQKYNVSNFTNVGASQDTNRGSERGKKISAVKDKYETEVLNDGDIIGRKMQNASHADMTMVAGHDWKKSKAFFSF